MCCVAASCDTKSGMVNLELPKPYTHGVDKFIQFGMQVIPGCDIWDYENDCDVFLIIVTLMLLPYNYQLLQACKHKLHNQTPLDAFTI